MNKNFRAHYFFILKNFPILYDFRKQKLSLIKTTFFHLKISSKRIAKYSAIKLLYHQKPVKKEWIEYVIYRV